MKIALFTYNYFLNAPISFVSKSNVFKIVITFSISLDNWASACTKNDIDLAWF